MSSRKNISTDTAPAAIGPYSQAVLCDGWLYCSGQIPLDPKSGEMITGSIEIETKQVLKNLEAVLVAAGLGLADVVKTTIFLTDLGNFGVVNELYGNAFGDARPARATVEVSALPKGSLVEIDCVARSSN